MKTRLFKSVGLLTLCLGGFAVAEDAYAFTGQAGIGVDVPTGGLYYHESVAEGISYGSQSFLAGFYGNLQSNANVGAYTDTLIQILDSSDSSTDLDFTLEARVVGGNALHSDAWAVYPGDGTLAPQSCSPTNRVVNLTAPNGGVGQWACYITSVENPQNDSYWNSYSDEAAIDWDTTATTNCQTGAVFPNTGGSCRGNAKLHCYNNAAASAMCVPISYWLGYGSNGSPTSATGPNSLGAVDNVNLKTCLMWQVWGTFRGSTSVGVGAKISGGNWVMVTGAGQGGTVDCVQ